MKYCGYILISLFFCQGIIAQTADSSKCWHNKERTLRYHPGGSDIVITNGNRRFTSALYGTNTAFRAEAGNLPVSYINNTADTLLLRNPETWCNENIKRIKTANNCE
jgi:hypothetical protein